MGKLRNLFTSGKMNKDVDERLLPKGQYRDALNVRISNSNGSDVGAVENALSNELKTSLSLGSNAQCIGVIADDKNKSIYWFVKSSTGSYVLEYNRDSEDYGFVLSDTRSNSVLNFSKNNLITGVNILIDSDKGIKYLYWTDGINPPRKIDIEKAKSWGVNGFQDYDISVIKAPPRKEPSIQGVFPNQFTNDINLIEDKFFSFSYRYQYDDGSYSAISPFSDFGFKPGTSDIDFLNTTTESMQNNFSAINISVNTGNNTVTGIEILARESDGANLFIIHKIDKVDDNVSDNVEYPFLFKNNGVYTVLSETQFNRVYDNVPLTAEAQEFIGNRLIYGNYTENYNLKDYLGEDIHVDINSSLLSEELILACPASTSYTIRKIADGADLSYKKCGDAQWTVLDIAVGESVEVCASELSNISTNTSVYTVTDNGDCEVFEGEKTLKSSRSYDVGIVYFDKYGRKTPVLTSKNSSVLVEHYAAGFSNKIKSTINFNAPAWADRYKFAVKQINPLFEVIKTRGPIYKVSEDSVKYIYIAMPQQQLNKIVEGGVLILKNNGVELINSTNKFNIISVNTYEAGWNDNSGEAGTYVKLEGPRELFEDSNYVIPTTDKDIIFETYPVLENESAYYEVPGTYDIVDGYHTGNQQNQTATQPAETILEAYNAYTFGNGLESIKIDDNPVKPNIVLGIRVNETVDDYRQNNRIASLTYSDVYDPTTNYNGLNQFNLSLANYKDINDSYGEIKKIHSRDNDLVVFQENKVSKILYSKSVLFNADGSGNVSQNTNILGQDIPYSGEYGISSSPESFQSWGYRMYFADERRGAVLRLSADGITEISESGMKDWFNKNLNPNNNKRALGGYDPVNDQYVLSIPDSNVEWLEDEYSCDSGVLEWREDTYSCVQATTTTTTTTQAPVTTTTTQPAGTTTTTTTQAPVGSYTCADAAYWVDVSYNPNTEAISVTPIYGSVTVHSYNPTTSPNNSGVVSITYVISDSNSDWDNTNQQLTCSNISVDTTVVATTTTTTAATTTTTTQAPVTTTTTTQAATTTTTTQASFQNQYLSANCSSSTGGTVVDGGVTYSVNATKTFTVPSNTNATITITADHTAGPEAVSCRSRVDKSDFSIGWSQGPVSSGSAPVSDSDSVTLTAGTYTMMIYGAECGGSTFGSFEMTVNQI